MRIINALANLWSLWIKEGVEEEAFNFQHTTLYKYVLMWFISLLLAEAENTMNVQNVSVCLLVIILLLKGSAVLMMSNDGKVQQVNTKDKVWRISVIFGQKCWSIQLPPDLSISQQKYFNNSVYVVVCHCLTTMGYQETGSKHITSWQGKSETIFPPVV